LVHRTYIDRITHYKLPILDNEPEMRVMASERQGLRADTASDVDDQRALRKVFPAVPYKYRSFKREMNEAQSDQTFQDGSGRGRVLHAIHGRPKSSET
jgi:hypothetical protein